MPNTIEYNSFVVAAAAGAAAAVLLLLNRIGSVYCLVLCIYM